jgi:hypothetical protein
MQGVVQIRFLVLQGESAGAPGAAAFGAARLRCWRGHLCSLSLSS